jgi:hypothetical protein
VLNLSHSEEDLADRSSDLVEGKSQDFENKKIRRLGRNKLCALVPRLSTGKTSTPTLRRDFFSASLTCVLSAWRAALFGRSSKSLRSGLSAGDVLYSKGMPEARKYQMGRKPLRLCQFCASCTQCETRSHVLYVPHHVRERFDKPQVCGNEDLPLLSRPSFSRDSLFPRRGLPRPMIPCVFETLMYDLQILARAAASAHSAMCWQHYCEV